MIKDRVKETQHILTSKKMLGILGMGRKDMTALLSEKEWNKKFTKLLDSGDSSAQRVLDTMRPFMENWAEEPEDGWLEFICLDIKSDMYPENFHLKASSDQKKAERFFLANYRAVLDHEKESKGFSPTDHIELLSREYTADCNTAQEYRRFSWLWNDNYIFEFMRISREITPFNAAGHIGGVHHLATFVGKQLRGTDIPIDMALLSGAAAGHDLGKFGCSDEEASRIPYLHYYYTDELLRREKMPMIAHIASNHSTWDLELENLSVESLLLIYADFRVKSIWKDGEEFIHFYTLKEAFDVILDKLDNVDDKKRHRYEKVYAKLKDFEDYLINMGIETDIDEPPAESLKTKRDTALLMGEQVVEHIKYAAIEHNIQVMGMFNDESAFGSFIEIARSEKQWKSQRAYLDIFSEYFTYMTKQEKLLTVNFLYELLSHREGDIRRQAGRLLGTIIAKYDDVYTKEEPDLVKGRGKNGKGNKRESVSLWNTYLHKIVFPDYRVTDQHRSWIGYTLKVVIQGLIENSDRELCKTFLKMYFNLFKPDKIPDSAVFVLLDSIITIPEELISKKEMMSVLRFAKVVSARDPAEIKIGAIRAAEYISGIIKNEETYENINGILENTRDVTNDLCVAYLVHKIKCNMEENDTEDEYHRKLKELRATGELDNAISGIFRENLKVGTPWVVKIVNIEFLLDHALSDKLGNQTFYLASHFSNLIKTSERVTVRHKAGNSLIRIAKRLPMEQINEIVVELTKGLEIGEYQFSKYIPPYLGELALYLDSDELDEFIDTVGELIENSNDKIGSVALDTVGEILTKYSTYKFKDGEDAAAYDGRRSKMLGMILKGMANYHEDLSEEAVMVTGKYIFGSTELADEEKFDMFKQIYKKTLTLINGEEKQDMNFFTKAAALNHIYRFISEYKASYGEMELPQNDKVAFFPGTFDPFSLSHKGIVQAIRDEGFEVYLALDEFSWSKKTQPRMIRKQIISMSVADEADVFLFDDDLPINIANPDDLKKLKSMFTGRELYMVVGSDVVLNASSYKAEPTENSIHSMNHIIFERETEEGDSEKDRDLNRAYEKITGDIHELKLPVYLEDISSTMIRENIDYGRDISNLIDPVAQNFIYDNSLYLREPQYKNVFEIKNISFEPLKNRGSEILNDLADDIKGKGINLQAIRAYMSGKDVRSAVIRNADGKVCAIAAVNELETGQLYDEFQDADIASYLRGKATGKMIVIRALYCAYNVDMGNLMQIIMTEVMAEAAANDITYGIYHPLEEKTHRDIIDILERQGFTEINIDGKRRNVYEVNMKEPIAMIENMDTTFKEPFNTDPKILRILEETHADMQRALTKLNPGNLVLSFNAGIMHQKIVDMVTENNGVPNYPLKERKLGECMCVPFGKILRGMAVPNTVTKTLHTEKMFSTTLDSFTIEEYPMYASIPDQVKTLRSFNRPVLLVDDLLHKGYRIKALDPIFKENGLEIKKIITGLLSGRGRDLMTIQEREVESAYFIPNMKSWFVESTLCPYIGGDGIESDGKTEANMMPSINLILPFAAPKFLKYADSEAVYDLSMVCLKNAEKIFKALEEEYQNIFERKLTIRRLSDVIISPRMPNGSMRESVDINLSPSVYMAEYIERLIRLKAAVK